MATTIGPANGHLLIHGGLPEGGQLDEEFVTLFKKLAGGPAAKIVFIPTAGSGPELADLSPVTHKQWLGLEVTVLHTRDRMVADSEAFSGNIASATGVYIEGGRQPLLAEAYLNTKTHQELQNLLDRGGVIAGNSAGATIQGSFMVRNEGAPDYGSTNIYDPKYPSEGFGFLKNAAIDQHITARGRQYDLAEVLKIHPGLLGIGIDENTAIHVQGDQFTVLGSGTVFVHNGPPPFVRLRRGQRYDLRERRVV